MEEKEQNSFSIPPMGTWQYRDKAATPVDGNK